MTQLNKQIARDAMVRELETTIYNHADNALWAIFGDGLERNGVPYIETALLQRAALGAGGLTTNDTVVDFPDELAIEFGGSEDRFGYVQMRNIALPDDEGLDQVPFDEALRLIEIAAKHYVSYRPDRKENVDELMAQARNSFARLQKNHEAWKRQNPTD